MECKFNKNETQKVTKEDFESYKDVQESGVTNMYDLAVVKALSGLTKDKIIAVMQNYDELSQEFGGAEQ